MSIKLLGIAGKKKSGKDTLLQYLTEFMSPEPVYRVAFADGLKMEVAKALDINIVDLEREKDFYRPILQWWGTEFRRGKYGTNYWLNWWANDCASIRRSMPLSLIITPDIRFLNEFNIVKARAGLMVKVVAMNSPHDHQFDHHESERDLGDVKWDEVFVNDFLDKEHMKQKAYSFYLKYLKQ